VRNQYPAHLQAGADIYHGSVHAKLDIELLAAKDPAAHRPLLGSKCDFKGKNGSDNNAAKRTSCLYKRLTCVASIF